MTATAIIWQPRGRGLAKRRAMNCPLVGRKITVQTKVWDLAQGVGPHLRDADLATASALFDLVSEDWSARFVAELATRRTPLFSMLTFDGR